MNIHSGGKEALFTEGGCCRGGGYSSGRRSQEQRIARRKSAQERSNSYYGKRAACYDGRKKCAPSPSGLRLSQLAPALKPATGGKQEQVLRRTCAVIAIAATLLVLAWTALRVHYVFGGNWTGVFLTGAHFAPPPDLQAGTYIFQNSAGYDGQFYRYVAHDPFLRKGYWRYVDAPRLRFRRVLIPLAAWLLGLGQSRFIDASYIAQEMFFVALGVYWCARLLVLRGRPPWWGVLFVVMPGTLASLDRMLVDGPLAAFFAGFWLYCQEERWGRVWVIAMLAGLTRETGLLLAAALVIHYVLRREWRRAGWFGLSALPALAWYGYLAWALPPDVSNSAFALPGWGLLQRLFTFRPVAMLDWREQILLLSTDFLALLGLILSIILATIWLRKSPRTPVTVCVGLFVALALVFGAPILVEPFAFGRPVSPMLLWLGLEAVSRKVWIAVMPPLMVSLGVSVAFASPVWTVVKSLLR